MVSSKSPPHWRHLNAGSAQSKGGDAHLPPFLISSSFTPTSYTIYLTDLTHIWSESLDRKAIIERSREEATSIDPSDSDDQLEIFLQKIKLGVDGGKDSALNFEVLDNSHGKGKSRNGVPILRLYVTAKLPSPLKSLEWPIDLSPGSRVMFTSLVTYPLLKAERAKMKEAESLLQRIKEKDRVIQKLVDSIESRGGDLGLLFPHAIGRGERRVTRKMIESRVKGMGLFDYDAWKEGIDGDGEVSAQKLLDDVFGLEKESRVEISEETDLFEKSEDWWKNTKGDKIRLSRGVTEESSGSNLETRPALKSSDSATKDEDAFQVQATPPRLRNTPEKPKTQQNVIDDSTEDEDDDGLDGPTQQSAIPDSFPQSPPRRVTPTPPPQQPKAKGKKLGGIGSRREPPPPRKSPSPAPLPKPTQDESTTEEEEEEGVALRPKSPSPPKKKTPPPKSPSPSPKRNPETPVKQTKRSTLGRIGAKKKDPTPEPEPEPEQVQPRPEEETEGEPDTPAKKTPTPKKKTKLGAIGRRRGEEAGSSSQKVHDDGDMEDDEDTRGRRRTKTPEVKEPTPPRETSEERADRKREQLKRELEQKAKVPVKKKRKF
ncbi:XRCC4-like factor-domain-containing protein [Xylogone sp. PMI_703]|nr:XRCC4-like factor-domain-containing protein [Xylogone sp. PMI_703]